MDSVYSSATFWITVLLALIILFYNTNQTFNFYCKLLLYNVIMLVSAAIFIPPSLLRPGSPYNTISTAFLFRFLCRFFGIRWVIEGTEYLEDKAPCVVLCNHQSSIDVIGMMYVWPYLRRCVPMIKKELKYFSGPFGILAALSGSVFIDRFNPDKARDTVNNTVNYLRQQNLKLWVFPEGTRNASGGMLPFKKGAFHIAVQGHLPILPIVFSSYSQSYDKKKKIFRPGVVKVTVLPPISTSDLESSDVNDLVERVRSRMLETFNKTSNIDVTDSANGKQ